MAEWGQVFNIGDTLQTVATIKAMRERSDYLAGESQRETEELERKRRESDEQSRLKRFALRRVMAQDLVRRARNEGLSGDALAARVGELFPAYRGVYSQTGDSWDDATPDAIIALGLDSDAEDEARKAGMVEGAKYGVRHQYGDTPFDQSELRSREAATDDERDQRNRMALEEYASKLRQGDDSFKSNLRRQEMELESKMRASTTAAPKPPTYEQGRASSFLNRMQDASSVIESLEGAGYTPDRKFGLGSKLGGLNEMMGGSRYTALGKEGQQWAQAEDQWINALLRSDTGAAYKDMEVDDLKAQFFPRAGDNPDVVSQKREARRSVMEGMRPMTGSAVPTGGTKPLPPGFVELPDGRVRGPDGRIYRRSGL